MRLEQPKRFRGWIAVVSGLLFWAVVIVLPAQNTKTGKTSKSNQQRGFLTGRVFGITKSGDLKPARVASVSIFFYGADDSAGSMYMEETNRAEEALSAEIAQSGATWSEERTCLRELHIYQPILVKILEWVQSTKNYAQVISLHTDEEGFFSTALPPCRYIVTVRGRAGFSEALWDTGIDDVMIKPGSHVDLKLASPSKSCINSLN